MMKKAIVMLSTSLLFACGGGAGSGSSLPPERPDGALSGIAHDNILVGADINVYALDGNLLGTGETDVQGRYSVDLDSVESQIVLVEATSGRYTEEFSGEVVELEEGDSLRAYVYYAQGGAVDLSVTLLSTISAGYAEYLMGLGVSASDAVSRANGSVSDMVGLDIESIHPVDVTDPSNAKPSLDQQLKYSFVTAAVSPLMAWVSDQNGAATHDPFNSIMFAQKAYDDIRHDGRLDGQGTSGVLAFGTVPVETDMYRNQLAINMLVMASNNNNATGIGAGDLLSFAEEYNSSNHPAFGAEQAPPAPLSAIAPNVTNFSWESGETVASSVTFSFDVADRIGMDSVTLTINGTEYVAGNPEAPEFLVDSTIFADGLYSVSVVARSVTGGTTTLSRDLTIANAGITITDVRPQDGEYIRGTYPFSATVTDPIAVNDVRFTVDSNLVYAPTDLNSPVEVIDTAARLVVEGPYTFNVWAENQAGYTADVTNTFYVDNTPPVVTWNLANGSYIAENFVISPAVSDNMALGAATLSIDGDAVLEIDEFETPSSYSFGYASSRSGFDEGEHSVSVTVADKAGAGASASRTFNVDKFYPTVNLLTNGGSFTESFTMSWNSNDTMGLSQHKVYLDNSLYATLDGSATNTGVTPSGSEGYRTIKVEAYDHSGKMTADSATVVFNHIPPTVSYYAFDWGANCVGQGCNMSVYYFKIRVSSNEPISQVSLNFPAYTYTVESDRSILLGYRATSFSLGGKNIVVEDVHGVQREVSFDNLSWGDTATHTFSGL
jgi:hypothetical protein